MDTIQTPPNIFTNPDYYESMAVVRYFGIKRICTASVRRCQFSLRSITAVAIIRMLFSSMVTMICNMHSTMEKYLKMAT